MGLFKDASDIQDRVSRAPFAIALALLLLGCIAYQFHWRDDPYRDGAERFLRGDAAIAHAAGEIRRVNLKSVVGGACKSRCDTYIFSVVGTRAIVRVAVESWQADDGQPGFRIQPSGGGK
jgi:hypothetical protein